MVDNDKIYCERCKRSIKNEESYYDLEVVNWIFCYKCGKKVAKIVRNPAADKRKKALLE